MTKQDEPGKDSPVIIPGEDDDPASENADLTRHAVGANVVRQTTSYAMFRTLASLSTLVSYALLVRILERRAIGVFEIGMAYVGFGFVIGEGGLGAALVRKKEHVTNHEYRVVLTSVLGVASLLAVLYLVLAPVIGRANHFNAEELWVMRLLAPIMVLRAFPVIPRARMQREMRFDQFGMVELSSTLARNVTAVIAAFIWGGPWALVAAALAQASVAVVASYALSPGWVGLGFQKHTFKRLISYGAKVQGTYFLHYLRENVAVALLGPAMGPGSVAMYRFAYTYARIPSDAIGGLARVHFRMYALCEPHSPQLASAIEKALRASVLLGALILGVLASAAIWSVPLIYSEKWLPALPIVWSVATWAVCGVTLLTGDQALDWIGWGQSLATVAAACVALRWASVQAASPVGSALLRPLVAVTIGALFAYAACSLTPGPSLLRALAGIGAFLSVTVAVGALVDRQELMRDLRGGWTALRKKNSQ